MLARAFKRDVPGSSARRNTQSLTLGRHSNWNDSPSKKKLQILKFIFKLKKKKKNRIWKEPPYENLLIILGHSRSNDLP